MDYDLIPAEKRMIFNSDRLKLYGYMGMIAPQKVMEACDKLTDYMFDDFEQKEKYNWKELRELALELLNEIRKDININTSNIVYNGQGKMPYNLCLKPKAFSHLAFLLFESL